MNTETKHYVTFGELDSGDKFIDFGELWMKVSKISIQKYRLRINAVSIGTGMAAKYSNDTVVEKVVSE